MATMDPVDAFQTLDLRVGRVTAAEPLAGAKKPAYKLTVDFGPLGVRGSSAQLTGLYRPEQLIGRSVIAAVNLGTRRIAHSRYGPMRSQSGAISPNEKSAGTPSTFHGAHTGSNKPIIKPPTSSRKYA